MIFDPMSPKYNEKIAKQSIEAMNALTRMAETAREHERETAEVIEHPDGVAGRVFDHLNHMRLACEHGSLRWFRIDGEYAGAVYMHAKLSRRTRLKIAAYEQRISNEEDMETQVIIARKRDAVVALAEELGLDLKEPR